MPFLNLPDIQMYYEIHGQGEPVLLIHGLGSSTRDWENQTPVLAQKYKVILVDLRGHGKSSKPDIPYSVPMFTKDVAAALHALAPGGVHVIGHSLGGMIAFQLVVDHPDLVKSMIIVNSGPAVLFTRLRDQFAFFMRSVSVKLFGMEKLSVMLAQKVFPKPEQEKLRQTLITRWLDNDPKAYLNSLKAFRGWNVLPRIGGIRQPTLVIAADRDYTSLAYKQMYVAMMPNAKLVEVKDSGHLTTVDQVEVFNEIIMNFLAEQIPSRL